MDWDKEQVNSETDDFFIGTVLLFLSWPFVTSNKFHQVIQYVVIVVVINSLVIIILLNV